MGVGGSILHSIWRQDCYYQSRQEEEEKEKQSYHRSSSSGIPKPIVCNIQHTYYLDHLKELPKGEGSKGQLQYIRLINKRKLLKIPLIHWLIRQYIEVLLHFELIVQKKTDYSPHEHEQEEEKDLTHISATTNPAHKHEDLSLVVHGTGGSGGVSHIPPEYEYRSGVRSKYAYNIYKNIQEEIPNTTKMLEKILLWKLNPMMKHLNFSDSFCELYEIDAHPPFTYISHRWVGNGQIPFGTSNELVVFLLLAKEDYIWLDCTCIPQILPTATTATNPSSSSSSSAVSNRDRFILDDGIPLDSSTMKLIWNIGKILDEASNIATYYAVDGWKTGLLPPPGTSNGLSSTSIGFLRLFQCLCASVITSHSHEDINELQLDTANRIWCYFERQWKSSTSSSSLNPILTPEHFEKKSASFLSPFLYDRFLYKRRKSASASASASFDETIGPIVPFHQQQPTDITSILISFHDHRRFHLEHICSLNCSKKEDLFPLTSLLYEKQLFPAIYQNHQFLCAVRSSSSSNHHKKSIPKAVLEEGEEFNRNPLFHSEDASEWVCGFRFPVDHRALLSTDDTPAESITRNHGNNNNNNNNNMSYGWYPCNYYDEKEQKERLRYYFAIHSTLMEKKERGFDYLVIMIHEDCLTYCRQYYDLQYLPYDDYASTASSSSSASNKNGSSAGGGGIANFFQKYTHAYEWNHYERAFCQLCSLKKQILEDEEDGKFSAFQKGEIGNNQHHDDDSGSSSNVHKPGRRMKLLPQRDLVKLTINPASRR